MEVILGKDAVIKFRKGDYELFICAESFSFNPKVEKKSIKTVGDGPYRRFRFQAYEYTIELSGLVPYDEPTGVTAFDLLEAQRQGVEMEFECVFMRQDGSTYQMIRGSALVETASLTGPMDFVGASFTLQGNGEPLFGVPPVCNAVITGVEVDTDPVNAVKKNVTITGVTNGPIGVYEWRFVPSVGAEKSNTALGPVFSFSTPVGGVLYVRARCDNGELGPEYSVNVF